MRQGHYSTLSRLVMRRFVIFRSAKACACLKRLMRRVFHIAALSPTATIVMPDNIIAMASTDKNDAKVINILNAPPTERAGQAIRETETPSPPA